jgi:RNA polymerase sigma-70 factor (ECF subfamily)
MPPRATSPALPNLRLVQGGAAARERLPPRPALDDTEILSAMRAGDESAASAFHDRARPLVDRTIARLLGRDDVDREDLAQLAFMELVDSLARFRGDCSLDAWISTVTAHIVYKHIRRRQLERRIFAGVTAEELSPAAHGSLAKERELGDLLERVRVHLEGMDRDKAWTFVLHDVCGYDLREIASITEVTVAAAQRRLVRGRNELHVRIEADPELAGILEELEASS